jgi:lysozyme
LPQIDKPKLKVSRGGLELIKSFEGFRSRAERLADGRWVVGHGHTLSAREGAEVSATDAELLLQYDLLPILNAISERVSLPLNQHQVDALASFGQAVGLERFLASDVLVWVNAGEPEDAARALGTCDAEPLTPAPDAVARRRAAESALFRHDPEQEANLAALLSAPATAPPSTEAAVETPVVAAEESGDARAMAVAHLLGEAADDAPEDRPAEPAAEAEQDVVVEPQPDPEPEHSEEPVVTPVFAAPVEPAVEPDGPEPAVVAANENGQDAPESDPDPQVQLGPEPVPEAAVPAPKPSAAMVMALQRYTPYVVPGGAVFQPLGQTGTQTEAPGAGVLVLTPPPEVEPEPPTREVWPEAERPGPAVEEEPLFIEDPIVRAGGQPVFMPESFEPERRGRLDWSETGAFLGMGAVGLTAFGAAVVGFTMAADRPVHYGVDQTAVASGVLALIGALCVGISAYNLYLHWARRGED